MASAAVDRRHRPGYGFTPAPWPAAACLSMKGLMMHRIGKAIVGVGLCATALPGCAALDSQKSAALPKQRTEIVYQVDDQQAKQTILQTSQVNESSSDVANRPDSALAMAQGVSQRKELVDLNQAKPPGRNIAEFAAPPKVQPPVVGPLPTMPDLTPNPGHLRPAPPPTESAEPLERALHCILNRQPDEALQYLKEGFDPTRQEYVNRLLLMLTQLNQRKMEQFSPEEISFLEQQLQSLQVALRSNNELTIDTMCLCESCEGYGSYTPVRTGHAYQPRERVYLYLELRNLVWTPHGKEFVSVLNGKVSIRDSSGVEVVFKNTGDRSNPLRSTRPRSDGFLVYDMLIPPSATPGNYTLTIEIADESTQPPRLARKSVDFTVAPARGN
jgi:hypothetical protein